MKKIQLDPERFVRYTRTELRQAVVERMNKDFDGCLKGFKFQCTREEFLSALQKVMEECSGTRIRLPMFGPLMPDAAAGKASKSKRPEAPADHEGPDNEEARAIARQAPFMGMFRWLYVVGSDSKNTPVIRDEILKTGIHPPDEFDKWGIRDKSAWAYANLPRESWAEICAFAELGLHTKSEWYTERFEDMDGLRAPKSDKGTTDRLLSLVCDAYAKSLYKGQFGFCQHRYRTDIKTDFYFLTLNDHASNTTEWRGGNRFEDRVFYGTFDLTFSYNRRTHELNLLADGDRKFCKALCSIWSVCCLGVEIGAQQRDQYHLQMFLTPDENLYHGRMESGRYECALTSLSVSLGGNRGKTVTFKVTDGLKLSELLAMTNAIGGNPENMTVTRAWLDLSVWDDEGAYRTSTFSLTRSSSNYLNLPYEKQMDVHAYLEKKGVLDASF